MWHWLRYVASLDSRSQMIDGFQMIYGLEKFRSRKQEQVLKIYAFIHMLVNFNG